MCRCIVCMHIPQCGDLSVMTDFESRWMFSRPSQYAAFRRPANELIPPVVEFARIPRFLVGAVDLVVGQVSNLPTG
jgi:hypothetical protein